MIIDPFLRIGRSAAQVQGAVVRATLEWYLSPSRIDWSSARLVEGLVCGSAAVQCAKTREYPAVPYLWSVHMHRTYHAAARARNPKDSRLIDQPRRLVVGSV